MRFSIVGEREKIDFINTQFAVAAAQQAVDESGIEGEVEPERFAVQFGTGIGGIGTFEAEHTKLIEKGPRRVFTLLQTKS